MQEGRLTFRFLAKPSDAGFSGKTVKTGAIFEWIDKVGYACSVMWAEGECVTAYVGDVNFLKPIEVGQLVEISARIVLTTRRTIHVRVELCSSDLQTRDRGIATHCILVFVAVDELGHSVSVRQWTPITIKDFELAQIAQSRIVPRAEIRQKMSEAIYTHDTQSPRVLFRFPIPSTAVNFAGNAHGGTVLGWMDDAALAVAEQWAGVPCATVYSGGIHFQSPLTIGSVIEVESRLLLTQEGIHIATHVRPADSFAVEHRPATVSMSVARPSDPSQEIRTFVPMDAEALRLSQHAQDLSRRRSFLHPLPI
jgi:4-hydroxybenzoyl-CoA thioesterase